MGSDPPLDLIRFLLKKKKYIYRHHYYGILCNIEPNILSDLVITRFTREVSENVHDKPCGACSFPP